MSAVTPVVVVKGGREKSLRLRHPWLFSGAIERIDGHPGPGETVAITGADGDFLAYAAFSPVSQIRARVWSFDRDEGIDAGFFARRVQRSYAARTALQNATHTGVRIVHGESDRSEEHTSELQSQSNLVCRLLLEKKKKVTHVDPLADSAYLQAVQREYRPA